MNVVWEKGRIILAVIFFLSLIIGTASFFYLKQNRLISPIVLTGINSIKPEEKPLEKYAIAALQKREASPSAITFIKEIENEKEYTSYSFFYYSLGKKVSGLANIPAKSGKLPVIIMLRGFVSQEIYTSGMGSKNSSTAFAKNGYITLAPDFLGYAESDKESSEPLEARFETYTTVMDLFDSLPNLNKAFSDKGMIMEADLSKIGIWGHSNGGHIALAYLEISGKNYPTVLWAPVSKPFPFSVLYFSDEAEDRGKYLRKLISDFEADYDSGRYSISSYLSYIQSPLQIHQGKQDQEVPYWWSDEFVDILESLDKGVSYYTYLSEDHNFTKGSWQTLIDRSISFYDKYF